MYYISGRDQSSAYYVTDTSDGVSELHSLESIRKFTELGLEIKGVDGDLVYPTLPVKYPCYTGESESDSKVHHCIGRDSGYKFTSLFFMKDGKLCKMKHVTPVLKDGRIVAAINDSKTMVEMDAYMIGQCHYISAEDIDTMRKPKVKMWFSSKSIVLERAVRNNGIYYSVLRVFSSGVADTYNDIRVVKSVLLENIISDASSYANVSVDGDLVCVRALDKTVTYSFSTLNKVYGRSLSDKDKLNVAKSRLIGAPECSVYENGDLRMVTSARGVLRVPDGVKTINRGSLIVKDEEPNIRVIIPDSVEKINTGAFVPVSGAYTNSCKLTIEMHGATPEKLRNLLTPRMWQYTLYFDGSIDDLLVSVLIVKSANINSYQSSIRDITDHYNRYIDLNKYLTRSIALTALNLAIRLFDIDKKFRAAVDITGADVSRIQASRDIPQHLTVSPEQYISRLHYIYYASLEVLLAEDRGTYMSMIIKYKEAASARRKMLRNYILDNIPRIEMGSPESKKRYKIKCEV